MRTHTRPRSSFKANAQVVRQQNLYLKMKSSLPEATIESVPQNEVMQAAGSLAAEICHDIGQRLEDDLEVELMIPNEATKSPVKQKACFPHEVRGVALIEDTAANAKMAIAFLVSH